MSDVLVVRQEGAILEVMLDRPKANAIDLKTSRMMGEVFLCKMGPEGCGGWRCCRW